MSMVISMKIVGGLKDSRHSRTMNGNGKAKGMSGPSPPCHEHTRFFPPNVKVTLD
jgi:hypothetical protein